MTSTAINSTSLVRFLLTSFLFISASGLWSCKSEEDNYFEEEALVQSIALGQMEAYDILEVDYLVENLLQVYKATTLTNTLACTVFSNDPVSKTLTIDFTNGCDSVFFHRTRSGKIIVSYPTTIGDTLANRTITFSNFVANKRKIEGEIDLEYISGDTSNITTRCRFKNFKVTFPDGTGETYNGASQRVWASGEGDGNPGNNSYFIASAPDSLTGFSLDGRSFTSYTGVQVLLNFYCASAGHFAATSGSVVVEKLEGYNDDRNRNVNFGASTCDNVILIVTSRRSFQISID